MTDATPQPSPKPAPRKIAPPTGTRDFYPQEMLLRRYITDAWRRTSLRHGFDEIDGPTFESAELYKVKSGEGILGEMFGVYSGKSPDDVESVKRGEPPFGLRPEFTPTLARMYAARAKQLPQPTKWFCVSNFFRAERPQRGRLREFFQWNCDVIGGEDKAIADVEAISCMIDLLAHAGLKHTTRSWSGSGSPKPELDVHFNERSRVVKLLVALGVHSDHVASCLQLLDERAKLEPADAKARAIVLGLDLARFDEAVRTVEHCLFFSGRSDRQEERAALESLGIDWQADIQWFNHAVNQGIGNWLLPNLGIVRGLAYYTGTVFEVIAEGERAVAGGGRYDNLIELFGGPPTPACGFGMGDVVLANLLADRKLVPEGRELLEALSRRMPVRPDAFVIASPNEHCDAAVVPLVARLRRGVETERYAQGEIKPWSAERYHTPPLHARRSYKATKNVGKLLADASACHARFAVIVERFEPSSGTALEGLATIKNLDTQAQEANVPLRSIGKKIAAKAVYEQFRAARRAEA